MFFKAITHQPFLCLVLQLFLTQLLSFGFTFLLSFILLLSTALYILLLLIYHVQTLVTCNKLHTLRDAATGRNRNSGGSWGFGALGPALGMRPPTGCQGSIQVEMTRNYSYHVLPDFHSTLHIHFRFSLHLFIHDVVQ